MNNVLLVDMNSFFASVHQSLDVSLRDKAVIVCGDPAKRHGIVLAASYEAKKIGVKTGMQVWEAKRLVPWGVFIRPTHILYSEFSQRFFKVLNQFSPLVEPMSIDEAFVDVSGCGFLGDNIQIAKKIKEAVHNELGILCSVGIGPNKILAKMAAELQKPDGLTLLTKNDLETRIWPLPAASLFGVGPSTARALRDIGIRTIGDLAAYPKDILEKHLGAAGMMVHRYANGDGSSEVARKPDSLKSIGHQNTLSRDCAGEDVRKIILRTVEKVCYRMRRSQVVGRTVSLTLRDTEFRNYSWSATLPFPTDITEQIILMSTQLFEKNWPKQKQVRLVGISVSNLMPKQLEQLDIFSENDKLRRLNKTCDNIKDRFGFRSVVRGIDLVHD